MKYPGQIVYFSFPQADLTPGKLRPALLLGQLPGQYDDWLICMISSQIHHYIEGFDEILKPNTPDFNRSGLKTTSIIRIGRLAVVEDRILLGASGEISQQRLQGIKKRLTDWLLNGKP